MEKKVIELKYEIYQGLDELSEAYQELIQAATDILENAHAPYSNFKVGAAVLLKSGVIVQGANQENASFPAGTCAERVALNTAGSHYPNDPVEAIAIKVKHPKKSINIPAMPCGICRQNIVEYEKLYNHPIEILSISDDGTIYKVSSVAAILPFLFSSEHLS